MSDPSGYTPRVAIITGSARGIGYSIALRLADDGVDVVINDLAANEAKINEVVEEIKKKGRRSIGIVADVSKEEDVIALVDKTVKVLGSLDVMIANAGIAPGSPLVDTPVEQLDALYNVNVRGTFLCYKHAAKQMIKQGKGGRIIGASSAAGKKGVSNLVSYSMSKFAVRGLTQATSAELRKYGITVNAYAPGIIPTPLILPLLDGQDAAKGDIGDIIRSVYGLPTDTPIGTTEVIAGYVSYLVKPESYFTNGQTVCIDGGLVMD